MLKALFFSHPVITDSRYYGHKTAVLQVPCDGVFVVIFFKTMYNKTIMLDSVSETSFIVKVSVSVISLSLQLG